ncbi:helix-turn-helix transcriptional regulator [Bordetella holmesii]|uniref:Transcriptional regulator, LuxR family n=2 Tax=Bordetella holmesii TaxID=35814 RepID=A0A158M5N0_9BORD|nr:LuxR C-terminal-related transcriptional regulator [Bordetella holmesii]AHV92783.1 bacterial regulatory s, luxR family protein [Bordetella holmesii ATCC 51541]AIT26138.1 bacterial regulatory s, luxR family protein [Bordetella holmesii 44057]EWM42458.1 bacterial regulatory s, luxR family protein [Bordetella holmesii 41130]EWM46709.1 bacterial regulatory s, luxR family protein [Bordetella holmesii 35009]EWM50876.1 bacterial regulatory s, luxR family protein [Bordetella holmesii 70147]
MDADHELRIASALYAGITDTDQWRQALILAARAVGTDRCTVLARNVDTESILVIDNAGLSAAALDEYERHYYQMDSFMEAARNVPTGGCLRDDEAFGPGGIRRSEFYNDFLYRHDIGSLMLTQAVRTPDIEWTVAFQRSPGHTHFEHQHANALGRLVPHLQKALQLRLRLRELERRASLGEAALDTFGTPLLFIAPSGRLLMANLAGEAWYSRHGKQLEHTAQWSRVLAAATGSIGPAVAEGMRLPGGGHIVALPAPQAYRNSDVQGPGLALVMVHTHLNPSPPARSMLKSLFGLSAAESRLLEVLMAGATLSQAAQQLGLSVETVRTQSKAVLQKTGTQRQAGLMRLVSALQSPMPAH